MKKLLKHKKALSPVVAAIILIAVTVAVSIAVAAWMGALTIGFMATEQLKITGVDFVSGTQIDITVQNTGTTKVFIVEARVTGGGASESVDISPEVGLDAGEKTVPPISVSLTGMTLVQGKTYDVEVITKGGNRFTYRATYPL